MDEPRRWPRDIPPLWLLASLLAMVGLHCWLPLRVWLALPWSRAGWLVVAAAAVLAGTSALRFRTAGTGIRPFGPATVLVAGGAFRRTRNPMYCGLLGVTVGVAIALGTLSPLLVPPLFFLVLDRRFVRAEEAFLRERFGADYEAYCRGVPRWL